MDHVTIYTDGGSRGNPGPAAYAYVIQCDGQLPIEEAGYMGQTTNNIAEYTGMVRALEHALELGAKTVTVYSDSELMVKQLKGEYRVKNEGLIPLYREAQALSEKFNRVTVQHVRREYNKHADRLCNEAMDSRSPGRVRGAAVSPPKAPVGPVDVPSDAAEPSDDGAPVKKKTATRTKVDVDKIHDQAIEILQVANAEWTGGAVSKVAVGEVWQSLWEMLEKSGILKKH